MPHQPTAIDRREFIELTGAGLLIVTAAPLAEAQRGGGAERLEARLHIAEDGVITILTGKIEEGQGALTELAMAAAEELRVPVSQLRMVLGDTDRVPNDGTTAGSRTTPGTFPLVRRAAAAARQLLVAAGPGKSYADLARSPELAAAYKQTLPAGTTVTAAKDWRVLGKPHVRLDGRDIVTGAHRFPSDIVRPNMLYGRVLRPPSYGAELTAVDLSAAQEMPGVTAMRDGGFVACAAPTTFAARQALDTISATARWKTAAHPSSQILFEHLRRNAKEQVLANAGRKLKATFQVAYVQHAPMEPRAAVAEWRNDRLTVWTGSSNCFAVRQALADAFRVAPERVRVLVPHMGGGFGGKHTGEAALEAARLAKEAGRPVAVRWTRAEEFTWAYFRPAALIDIEAGLDASGSIAAWDFTNCNSGASALASPYRIASRRERFVGSDPPLRQGSYRCLAAMANNFAREAFTDELAEAAGQDPLEFRLAQLDNPRIKSVLVAAAERFRWAERRKKRRPGAGVGLACGTEKNSVVAACCEVEVDRETGVPRLIEIVQAFECGAILNPANLRSQVEGCIMMGLGPALREAIEFQDGRLTNAKFASYRVPRFRDLPKTELILMDRKDMEPVGAGETPIIAVAPAIANAVFHATGHRARSMPIRAPRKG
ncbi:MAG: xanthine dehydrogenase family protein molybdopterin-binding subunit [Acidobacteria bacterium]|nr:xanthine dehydrogenase family protein molybdopterin-binding subunit [Acidobacteriota bacterium]